MANHASAKKRIRSNAKRMQRNAARKSRIKTFIIKLLDLVEAKKKDEAQAALSLAQGELHKGVTKGVLHKRTAARKISRLAKKVASI